MCAVYKRQFDTDFLAIMPTNLYGPGDNYEPSTSHLLPGLMCRFHGAKVQGAASVEAWGAGLPCREFLCSYELPDAYAFGQALPTVSFRALTRAELPLLNIGTELDCRAEGTGE